MIKTPDTLGTRIRAAQKKKRLTQVQLAEAAGMTQAGLSGLESGRNEPTVATLRRIAEALKIRPGKLLDELEGR